MTNTAGFEGPQQPPYSARPQHTHNDYTIGVLCALAVEKAAFVAMLDDVHEVLPTPKNDDNSYTFGRIGNHNIVAACLPAGMTGNNSAATVAKDMLRSFPIKIGLMVGVGGGVWSKKVDVRLGDVVVSQPEGIHGGVVQWDFGKVESGGLNRTGSLNKPPRPLLNAVQDIKTKHITDGDGLAGHLSKMVRNKPQMAQTFTHQGMEHDYLYEPDCPHTGGETCDGCDIRKTVKRQPRITSDPCIHYGNIASGNKVIKNGHCRDRIAQELGVICFEMEAAGLIDSFPCLVIRGICDYADSHKNKRWQPYAAATAAAFAKELLGVVKKQGLDELEPVRISPYLVPFTLKGVPRVSKFVDRPVEMKSLELALLPRLYQSQSQRIYVLHGLGGIGKTQLTVKFAQLHNRRFSSVFWLDGRNEDILKRSIAGHANRIPQGQIAETSRTYAGNSSADVNAVVQDVLAWLARPDNTAWLLIFDNVDREYSADSGDAHAYHVEDYFSMAQHGSILITTRLARLEQLGESQQLGKVDEEQARKILETKYKKAYNIVEGQRLLQQLDGLPLAIAQAGAYLQETGVEIKKYLEFYHQEWSRLMESQHLPNAPLKDYPDRSVWTTWALSYQAIRSKHKATANLLLLWSYLDNKDLWYELFSAACKASETSRTMLFEWIGDIAKNEIDFYNAIGRLRNYSLVESIQETRSYATHPVVHKWAFHCWGEQSTMELYRLAVVVVGSAVPRDTPYFSSALCSRLLPHVQSCSRRMVKSEQKWALRVNTARENSSKENEKEEAFLEALYLMGLFYNNQGKLVEAKQMYERALQGQEKLLGPTHESTLTTVNDLAVCCQDQEKLAEAEPMYERARRGREREVTLGPDHVSTLQTINNLGVLYADQGRLSDAQGMLEQAFRRKKEALGLNNISTLNTLKNLSAIYARQGRLDKAQKMFERALQGFENLLCGGRVQDYLPALDTLENLGDIHKKQGEYHKACTAYLKALYGLQGHLDQSSPRYKQLIVNFLRSADQYVRRQGHISSSSV
ncbi:Kinesin [Pyrenophora tritici-repentis]|nr:Kinesin [Pyrenophora tritici-repentis]KAI0606743.1 Kinesin [Pyrenophora tritici-repentis]